MAMESLILAAPVLVLGFAFARYFPLAAKELGAIGVVGPPRPHLLAGGIGDELILVLGAGVYEELVFRLILFTLLALILKDAFGFHSGWAGLVMVLVSGVLFSAYHYLSPYEEFRLETFLFRTAAGVYFGLLFLLRGFGITAASHSAYDILIVLLTASPA